jgi:hypothetical protein
MSTARHRIALLMTTRSSCRWLCRRLRMKGHGAIPKPLAGSTWCNLIAGTIVDRVNAVQQYAL